MKAVIYRRRNGMFGAAVAWCQDTGHHIWDEGGDRFTVMSCDDTDQVIAFMAARAEACEAIAADWQANGV